MDLNARLRQLAREQGGAFTRRNALVVGYTAGQIRHRLTLGAWTARRRGIYVFSDELTGASVTDRARLLGSAATLAHPGSVVSHHTAAALHGLPLLGDGDGRVHVTRPGWPRKPWYLNDVVVHAAGSLVAPTYVNNVPCTSVARTVVDLARWSTPLGGLMAAEHALHGRLVEHDDVRRTLADQATWPWVDRAEFVLGLASGQSESPGESFSRLFFHEHGIDQPAQQVEVRRSDGRFVARVDFLWPEGVVGEFDGMAKYDDPAALRAEKLRQEEIERTGRIVVRWTWRDLAVIPATTARRISSARAEGARRAS